MRLYLKDGRFLFFALGALLALLISAPNTYQIAAPLHGGGTWYGIALTVALVVLLEAGAVGAEIAGVRWLCFTLLGLTFVANCTIGSVYLERANLAALPSLAAWRASGYGWLLVLGYAAIVPVLLYTFLHYAIARGRELGGATPATPGADLAAVVVPQVVEALRPMLQAPPQAAFARPALVADMAAGPEQTPDPWACAACGEVATTGQRGAAGKHGYWRCKGCGARQERQNGHNPGNLPD